MLKNWFIKKEKLKIEIYSLSEKGVRENNEDYIIVHENWQILCDGMGGENAGEIAAKETAEFIDKNFFNIVMENNRETSNSIKKYIQEANKIILEMSKIVKAYNGMGTTVVCTYVDIKREVIYIANVGDSRFYLYRDNKLMQITDDHSILWLMYKKGKITKEEARLSSRRNVIESAVGKSDKISINQYKINMNKGDIYLMCSDGLHDYLSDEEILKVIKTEYDISKLPEKLYKYAQRNESQDNVSVIVINVN